jgi:hypothetical protein
MPTTTTMVLHCRPSCVVAITAEGDDGLFPPLARLRYTTQPEAGGQGRPTVQLVRGAVLPEPRALPKAAVSDVAGWADDVPKGLFMIEPAGVREIRVEGSVLKIEVLFAPAEGAQPAAPRFVRLSVQLADGVAGNLAEEDFRDTARQVRGGGRGRCGGDAAIVP